MIFFTVFFGTLPLFAIMLIPIMLVNKAIDISGQEKFTKEMALKCVGYGVTAAAIFSFFIASIFWIGKSWIPLMASTFGGL